MTRESMEYDVVIVGAGPAGLSCAIRLKQLNPALGVCVLEKGSEVGAHLLSGAVFEPRALAELFPDWQALGTPLTVPATDDRFLYLTQKTARRLPTPPSMHNQGNYVISLGELGRWLATQAEALGVEIYPGFAAAEILYHPDGRVKGVATGDAGIGKDGQPTANHAEGMELHARQTVFAEGCRGSLTKQLFARFDLRRDCDPQTYALGIKELWQVDPAKHQPGSIMHTIGWPLDQRTYGGGWVYHFRDNLVSIGFVTGLDYTNPWLSPFEEMQRFKTHPAIADLLAGGKRLEYGARALTEGGLQSLPKLTFPGGLLVGDTAGFLNVPKIKGNHLAMKSGMVAAEALAETLVSEAPECTAYLAKLQQSWLWPELSQVRNIRPGFRWGLVPGLLLAALDTYIFRGHAPWTLRNHADHTQLKRAKNASPITYPKPDGVLTFDRLSSVFLSNTNHEENQPPHLVLREPERAITVNYADYASPESRYCPAAVYEIVDAEVGKPRLQINAQNCVHCKTCDIKDPTQNIDWQVPEGGGGPNYAGNVILYKHSAGLNLQSMVLSCRFTVWRKPLGHVETMFWGFMFDVEILVPTLETSRLILRPLRRTDAANIQKYFPHPGIVEFLDADIPWPYPPDGALSYLDTVALPAMEAGLEYRWAITLKGSSDQLIGTINLYPFDHEDSWGFWLAEPFHKRGLMAEAVHAVMNFAFFDLGLRQLGSHCAEPNTGSRKLKELSGAKVAHVQDNVAMIGGTFKRIHWTLSREDWIQSQKAAKPFMPEPEKELLIAV